jgi:hypothetical protein
MKRVRLSVDIEKEMKHQIVVLAALRGVTISDLVVGAVRRLMTEEHSEELISNPSSLAGVFRRYADAGKRAREGSAWSEQVADDLC